MSQVDHNLESQQQTPIEVPVQESSQKDQIPTITRELINKLNQYEQDQQLTLEDSIPILYDINIFQELTSIPEAKVRLANQKRPNARLQLEARFIYNLWKLIDVETIQFREFKQIVMLFMTCNFDDLMRSLQQTFEDSQDTIIQLMAIWEGMIQQALQSRSRKNSNYNCQQFALSESNFKNLNINQTQDLNPSKKSSYLSSNNKRAASGYSKNVLQKQNYQRPSVNNLNSQRSRMSSQNMKPRNYTEREHYSNRNSTATKNNQQQNYGTYCYEVPVMSVQKQKQLVDRLYKVDKYEHFKELKRIQDAQKIQKQLEQCTFRPNITKKSANSKVDSRRPPKKIEISGKNKVIPGFEKAIKRMKQGQQKSKQLKEQLQLRNIVIKNYTEQERRIAPPKFLNRINKEGKICLFTINFQIGKHKLATRVHQDDTAEKIARNIQSIYSLKQESYQQIRSIIQEEIEKNYILKQKEDKQKFIPNEQYSYQNNALEDQFGYQNNLLPQNSTQVLQGYIY